MVSLLSGIVVGIVVALLTLWLKDFHDRKKLIRYLFAEVRENLAIYELNQELLEGFAVKGAKYEGPRHLIVPFRHSAWETSKAEGCILHLRKELQKLLENLYVEIDYENRLIMDPTYLTSGDKAKALQDRMSDLLPELLETLEQKLMKELDS